MPIGVVIWYSDRVLVDVLGQDELAFTLGAAACLRKPFTQQAFLEALDAQLVPMAPGSR